MGEVMRSEVEKLVAGKGMRPHFKGQSVEEAGASVELNT